MSMMHNPPHPGELLSQLWFEPLRLSVTQAAEKLNVSRKTLSEIVNARASVSAAMALRLEQAFGKSAESWLGHQAAFDLWTLKRALPKRRSIKAPAISKAPVAQAGH